jgi:adenylate cyclase
VSACRAGSLVVEHDGRIIDTAGDGILAEFGSVLNAVICAVAVQKMMADRNTGIEPARRMQFRIGINQGDVVFDEKRMYGDGINVAARLESIAEPGGICVSGKVHDEICGRIDLTYLDIGEQDLKNIARPVRVYRVVVGEATDASQRAPHAKAQLALPDRPSIAVLPFAVFGEESEQAYFADGVVEDIISALSLAFRNRAQLKLHIQGQGRRY